MNQQLQEYPDPTARISAIEQQISRRRQQLDQHLGSLGRLQQQQQNLEALQVQLVAQKEQMQVANASSEFIKSWVKHLVKMAFKL